MPLVVAFYGNTNPDKMLKVETIIKYFSFSFSINEDVCKTGHLYFLCVSLQTNDKILQQNIMSGTLKAKIYTVSITVTEGYMVFL